MSTAIEDAIKRWTAKRKSALVMEILQGKTTVAEASRLYDQPPFRDRDLDRRGEAGDGERAACQPAGHPGAVREADQATPGSLWGSDAGAAARIKLQSLLGEDEK